MINVLMDGNCWQKSSKWTYIQITLLGLASLLFDNLVVISIWEMTLSVQGM